MPLYLYQCSCGNETEAFNRMADRHTHAPECTTHGQMRVKLTPVIGYMQRDCHYKCPVTGKHVTTNRQRTNIMREHNLIDANDFPLTPKVIEQEELKLKDRAALGAKLKEPLLIHD